MKKLTRSEQGRRAYKRQQAIRFTTMSNWEIKKELRTEGITNFKKYLGKI